MKCIHVTDFARAGVSDLQKVIVQSLNVPIPSKPAKGEMVIQVLACSLSPGDWRGVNGSADYFRKPETWPYIPGHDVCGVVTEVEKNENYFNVGDMIVSTSTKATLMNGLAEYAIVETAPAAKVKHTEFSPVLAATLPTSAQRAYQSVTKYCKKGDRVLVLGGSGGFGLFCLQFLKSIGNASFVATTSTQKELISRMGVVDRIINYNEENWWEIEEFKTNKFDLLLDCIEGKKSWDKCSSVLKSNWKGGRFYAVTLDDPDMEMHSRMDFTKFAFNVFGRTIYTSIWKSVPYYQMIICPQKRKDLETILELAATGKVKVYLDPSEPLPFTAEGAQKAFQMINSKHAHGKIVIDLRKPS